MQVIDTLYTEIITDWMMSTCHLSLTVGMHANLVITEVVFSALLSQLYDPFEYTCSCSLLKHDEFGRYFAYKCATCKIYLKSYKATVGLRDQTAKG